MRHQDILWDITNPVLQLKENDVHVWLISLIQPRQVIINLEKILSVEEVDKARRFHFRKDHDCYIIARATLRQMLAKYLSRSTAQIAFSYTKYGKPQLFNNHLNLQFNISHSHELALLAFTLNSEIGVDIEYCRDLKDGADIANHYFAKEEITKFNSLPVDQQHQAFFHCWTRKEAFIKAIGEGLSYPLDKFVVTLTEEAKLLNVVDDPLAIDKWRLIDLKAANNYAAALAIANPEFQLTCGEWSI